MRAGCVASAEAGDRSFAGRSGQSCCCTREAAAERSREGCAMVRRGSGRLAILSPPSISGSASPRASASSATSKQAAQWLRRAARRRAGSAIHVRPHAGRGTRRGAQPRGGARLVHARPPTPAWPTPRCALAEMMSNGRGGPRDLAAALELFEKAAEKGHSGAMFALGALYGGGHDLPVDRDSPERWFRAAAEHGHGHAQLMLGRYLAERRRRRSRPRRGARMARTRRRPRHRRCRGRPRRAQRTRRAVKRHIGGSLTAAAPTSAVQSPHSEAVYASKLRGICRSKVMSREVLAAVGERMRCGTACRGIGDCAAERFGRRLIADNGTIIGRPVDRVLVAWRSTFTSSSSAQATSPRDLR